MATVAPNRCPSCGVERPADAPRGHCPRCLLRAGFDSGSLTLTSGGDLGAAVDLGDPPGVLETLAASVGPVPRVLLRRHRPRGRAAPGASARPGRRRPRGGRAAARRRGEGQAAPRGPGLAAGRAGRLVEDPRLQGPEGPLRRRPGSAHWKEDPDLAGVRDGAALAALPQAERDGWQALWAEVDRLLERATKAR